VFGVQHAAKSIMHGLYARVSLPKSKKVGRQLLFAIK
jgi:hypothetical protein